MWKRFAVMAVAGVALLGACGDPADPPERVVTPLDCDPDNTGEGFNCALELQEPAGLTLKLETFTCGAHGNTVRILEPVDEVLTTDACYVESGTTWEYPGPFPTNTEVRLEIISAELQFSPGYEITGEYPEWVVYFEDGGDDDFDDLVLTITATPAG